MMLRRQNDELHPGVLGEFDDCVRVAAATGQPVKAVQAEALRVWLARTDKRPA